jgi:hypothetical protein
MSNDPFHLGVAGQARHAALILEAQDRRFEHPAREWRSWLRWVQRRAAALIARARAPMPARILSIHIEIKYQESPSHG